MSILFILLNIIHNGVNGIQRIFIVLLVYYTVNTCLLFSSILTADASYNYNVDAIHFIKLVKTSDI